ncbi:cation diffusion facilitator family transporter [Methylophaga sp. OBS1]|uniref:cation diffusion facilitator family transporter n=1 Tax=Methylophaga sp. OBS1 TaxID=2991933 RepID=UPI00225A3623|nr:cation diffusion facilitator family transporter [Methylophaga sp. OBS1]MCX4191317.1 cation diffusion facilitator family transporter [Methylophaga sp. OBS1]MCX4191737.1 cation diffusion facilitator family transporter [Methylophaga sp. OBS1]
MNKPQQIDRARLLRLATYASVATAVTLILAKLVAWFISDSVSILATLVDSSLDVLASIVNLIAVHHALQPADREHRFGHGKAEALAGLGQSMFIAGSAGILLLQGISRLINPQPLEKGLQLGLGVMLLSIVATLALISFQRYVIRRTDSTAIKADALHYKTDLLVNASVIVALLLTYYGWDFVDPLFAIGIALFILYSAWQIVREAVNLLMDHELPDEDRQKIGALITQHPDAIGFHDLRTRQSGNTVFVQLHLELNENLSLRQAHSIADELEKKVAELFDDAEVIIHEDPVTHMPPGLQAGNNAQSESNLV